LRLQSYDFILTFPNFTLLYANFLVICDLSVSKSPGGKMYHPGSKSAAKREKRQERALRRF
jgi:hypothetical protein